MLLKASSRECYVHCNLVLCGIGQYMCLPHHVARHVSNEIDYGKVNVETNSNTAVSTRTTLLTWREALRNIDVLLHC